ncbi:MAG: hypothetical protein OEU26_27335, partial [Candidatus Tectomicrobia bacterium]|nr:hypothetical protein [Candidatus Tectomicrobia bacterium]
HDYSRTLLHDLDGHFALLAYDAMKDQMIAATDFNNLIPIFYSVNAEGALLSSSELALAKIRQAEIDPLGFAQAVQLGVTWNDTTRFKQIAKLQPCELLTIDAQYRIRIQRYWEPRAETLWTGTLDDVMAQWMPLLRQGVQKFYHASRQQHTVWTDFTAGEDARLVVAQCQALGLPYKARVGGFPDDAEIQKACAIARDTHLDIEVQPFQLIGESQVATHARAITLSSDGYGSFFYYCTRFATDMESPPLVYNHLHFSGMPGGEAFRGTYYPRAKLLFPSAVTSFDHRFFTRLKYLLDYIPGLLPHHDYHVLDSVYESVEGALKEVETFPAGIQVDHLLRIFQTCLWGLERKKPFYHPLGTKPLTRSIYTIPPHFKKLGKLTKACTEQLYPQLARTKTQYGVPTIRRRITRMPLFLPEHVVQAKKIANGIVKRLYRMGQRGRTSSGHYSPDVYDRVQRVLFNQPPFSSWFASSRGLLTGSFYDAQRLDPILLASQQDTFSHVQVLARIVNLELACRYVYDAFD